MTTNWGQHWINVRRQVEADPELQRLGERITKLGAGTPAGKRVQQQYLARHRIVQAEASRAQSEIEVDQKRADKAAYMREYRAAKRAVREAVDALRSHGVNAADRP